MKVIIIEDEPLAVGRLRLLLQQYDPGIEVVATLESIAEILEWFNKPQPIDLILMDIQLADGSAFEIFQQIKITVPVIFTTAYDQFALEAFRQFSLDYLLKPVNLADLTRALEKMKLLRTSHQSPDLAKLAATLPGGGKRFKSRFLGKVGQKFFFVEAASVAYFYAGNKLVYLVGMDNSRYVIEQTLDELVNLLDPELFFRISRSVILQASAIEQVKPFFNSRLKVILKSPLPSEDLIISRERVAAFKKWADS